MDPPRRPAGILQVAADILGIAHQVIAAPVVFQIVITAQPADMGEFTARAKTGGAVHPGQHDIGLKGLDLPAQAPPRAQVQASAEGQLNRRQATRP